MDTNKIEELRRILATDLNIGVPGTADLGDKMGLIMMVCYLTNALQKKKPTLTFFEVIKFCVQDGLVNEVEMHKLALICEWFSNGCLTFPDLGIKAKDMPVLIKKGFMDLCPF